MVWAVVVAIGGVVGLAAIAARATRLDPDDDSLVRVGGTARPREGLLTAPVSRRPCCAYAVELYFDGE